MVISQEKKDAFDYTNINENIERLHKDITTLIAYYQNKIKDDKLRVPLNIGLHDFFSDTERYVYRHDAFFYFNGNTPKRLRLFYEQTDTDSLKTEIRIMEIAGIDNSAPLEINVEYVTWGLDEEGGTNDDTIMELTRFSDKIKYPRGARIVKYTLSQIKKPREKYRVLLEYRNILKDIERNLEYNQQDRELKLKNTIRRSLDLGVNN